MNDNNNSAQTQPVAAPRRTWLMALPALAFAGLAVMFAIQLQTGGTQRLPSALIGQSVPQFDLPPLPQMTTPGFATADLKTGKVSIVNVWASWCVPCRDEHPLLEGLNKDPRVQLIGLNYKDNPENARRFLGQLGNPFARIGVDATGRTAIDWGVYGVPETFVVDTRGRIAYKHVGPLSPQIIQEKILPAIEAAAKS